MVKHLLLLCFVVLFLNPARSQSYSNQKLKLSLYNIGVGAFVGGFGAFINKDDDEKGIDAFLKGFGVGAAGGALITLGKDLTYQIHKNNALGYAWLARLTNAAGASVVQNAYNHNKWWTQWNLNALGLHMEYNVAQHKFRARLLFSTIVTSIVLARQSKFNLGKTLKSGILFFEKDGTPKGFGLNGPGISLANSIAIDKNLRTNNADGFYSVVAHEVVHTLQFDNFYWGNPLFKGIDNRVRQKSRLYSNLAEYIHLDLNGVFNIIVNGIQSSRPLGCRLYEREAEVFSNRLVPFCD